MRIDQPDQGFCIACYSANQLTASRCSRCGYPAILRYPAPSGLEEAALLPLFATASESTAWSQVQEKLNSRETWLSAAAIESIRRFVVAEMDYSAPSDRGLGRMTSNPPRLAGWKRSDIAGLSPSDRDLLSSFITQLILAGYGNHISLLLKPKNVSLTATERLYELWIPRIYGLKYDSMLPDDLRSTVSDTRARLAGLFQFQYEKVLGLRVGMLGKIKFGTIAYGYFDGGALLANCERELTS